MTRASRSGFGFAVDQFLKHFLEVSPNTKFVLHAGQSEKKTFELIGISSVNWRYTRLYVETQILFRYIHPDAHDPNLGDCIHACTISREEDPTDRTLGLHNGLVDAHWTSYVMLHHQAGLQRYKHLQRQLSKGEMEGKARKKGIGYASIWGR
jgi:hypothetical protein